ncbi:zinc finger protein 526-like [Ixodes scapularis]
MPTMCLMRNCSTTYRSAPNVRFHNLPREQHRRALWLRAIDRDGPDDIGDRVGHLCSDHFLPGDYETNIQVRQSLGLDTKHARLKSEAVPTQNLWFSAPPRKRRRSEVSLYDV